MKKSHRAFIKGLCFASPYMYPFKPRPFRTKNEIMPIIAQINSIAPRKYAYRIEQI